MFTWLGRKPISPVYVMPGDTIVALLHGKEVGEAKITEGMTVNSISFFEVQNEFGLEKGVGAIFGETKEG